tara:strand:- start:722 stop:949 length:228 start_codon:yes stop_codon:yes gene_type:complete
MGKSFKKNPIEKVNGHQKDSYWGTVRSRVKTALRSKHYSEIDEGCLPDPKEIVNDYNYIDQIAIFDKDDKKARRK